MSARDDAFDRVVQREEVLRERAALFDSPARLIKLYWRFMAALGCAWALFLVAHWTWLADPRLLAVLHTIVFVLVSGYVLAGVVVMTFVRRRRPDFFEDF